MIRLILIALGLLCSPLIMSQPLTADTITQDEWKAKLLVWDRNFILDELTLDELLDLYRVSNTAQQIDTTSTIYRADSARIGRIICYVRNEMVPFVREKYDCHWHFSTCAFFYKVDDWHSRSWALFIYPIEDVELFNHINRRNYKNADYRDYIDGDFEKSIHYGEKKE